MKLAPLLFSSLLLSVSAALAAPVSLFDGKTLKGWDGDPTVWRVVDGVIVGGFLEGNPQNEFLTTQKRYRNFILKLEYKLVGTEGFVNGGVQFRSKRIPQPPNEMSGYQADIGAGYTGFLYDESRRKRMLAEARKEMIAGLEKPGEWNTYEIRAEDSRIQLFVNGQRTVDYTEREPGIEKDGLIALQIHGKCKAQVSYRNITIDSLSDAIVPGEKEVLQRFGNPDAPAKPRPPFKDGRFSLEPDEVVVFAGQENLVREAKSGTLEALLTTAYATQRPRFRSMAWEGDTVYEQWRDLNFGSWKGQLDSAEAGIVMLQFGQMEAFDGAAKLPQFASAYHRLLDQLAACTPRLVLLSPMPFEVPTAPNAPDLTQRNTEVAAYAKAVQDIAKQRGAVYVDLFTPLAERAKDKTAPRLTEDGIHLTSGGLRTVAELIASQLGASSSSADNLALLKDAIVEKNRLWFDCWRPANWSFVYGDRVTQMFGKPADDAPSLRESFEAHKPLIAKWDAHIQALARGEKSAPVQPAPPVVADALKPLSPAEQMAAMTVAEGYEINLFASEELDVAKPTQFAWDEKGRLYIACSPTYPQAIPGVKPTDYILVLEDTDGDGKADKSHRFAEGLTMVQGVEPGAGGVYVCDFDRLLHLKDTDGDGKADQTTLLYSGFGIGDTHQLVNSICHGPDGSLWFTQGLHAFSRVETPWGLSRLEKAGVWSLNPRTLRLQAFFNGGKAGHNCWGVAFDDYFQVFHKSGDRPDGYYSVPGLTSLQDPDEYHPVGPLFMSSPKTNSLEIIGTAALPQDIQGCALIGGYFGNVVELHRFSDLGSGFKTEQLPRLVRSTDTSFRPVDVSVGPDGALYLADWLNPVIGHYQASYADPRRDRTHGRIWRISAKGYKPVKQPALAQMQPAELLQQLHSPERWTRYQARRLLFDAPDAAALSACDAFVATTTDERVLMEVCGIYQAHMAPRPALLQKLLAAKDARVRAYAARVIASWHAALPNAQELLTQAVRDVHPRVRLEAVVACSHVPTAQSAEVAVQALDQEHDKFIDYALKQSVKALEPQWKKPLAENKLTFGGKADHIAYVKKVAATAPQVAHPGQAIYDALCLNCHQPGGKGLPGVYPPLEGSEWVAGDKDALIKIVLHGLVGPIKVAGTEYGRAVAVPMPPMGLDDQQAADVLSFVRSSFGHKASPVTPEEVKTVRAATSQRASFWTPEELLKK